MNEEVVRANTNPFLLPLNWDWDPNKPLTAQRNLQSKCVDVNNVRLAMKAKAPRLLGQLTDLNVGDLKTSRSCSMPFVIYETQPRTQT